MRVVVLGAGVIGVTTAWWLARAGADVVVLDRQPGPALETSFANGGQISANHATPWAAPGTPRKALKWLGRIDAPLLLHLRYDPPLFAWLIRFLANCTRARPQVNIERALRVALYSRRQMAVLRAETDIAYDQLARGILHIFRNRDEYEAALPSVELMNRLGCERRLLDVTACVALEPALASVQADLIGGMFSPDDESGDAYTFTVGLAAAAQTLGAVFRWNESIARLLVGDGRITAAETATGEAVAGDAFVLALGSYAPLLLKPLGLNLPVYPGKGYSVTIPVANHSGAPTVSLIDDEFKMVYSRLGDRLRVAGTAEFAGYDTTVTPARARFLLDTAMRLFPDCGDPSRAAFWAGLRPSTPDGVPVIGRAPGFDNLVINNGHGTLGWTMAAGAGRLAADLVLGRPAEVPLDGLGLERFR
ncbi:MAG TPA: D-amino acid dehydrogenase [Rhodospirillales bacterium]|nr:D-amino acid dehydrogenase [Rhodospirillales bacterium]